MPAPQPAATAAAAAQEGSAAPAGKSIQVYVRIRPMIDIETNQKQTCNNLILDAADPSLVTVVRNEEGVAANSVVKRSFRFNRVFGPNSTQDEVYTASAQDAVNSALDGFHGVMFVYGQTGSGKTFTISNNIPGKEGVLQRAVGDLWKRIESDRDHEYSCKVSYVQLYNEVLMNLLEENPAEHRVKLSGILDRRTNIKLLDETTSQPIDVPVTDYRSTMQFFQQGSDRKEMSSTKMNNTSSRSHTVFTVTITKAAIAGRTTAAADGSGGASRQMALEGKLILCDLAGCERIKKTEATGKQLDEATHINQSLLVLGRVVAALTDKKGAQHAPFRESKLTRILQYSLCGFGRTTIIVNVSPSDFNTDETYSAMLFGQRAIQIQQNAQRHETIDYKALYLELQAQMDKSFDAALANAMADQKRAFDVEMESARSRIEMLEAENAILRTEIAKTKSSASNAAAAVTPPTTPAGPRKGTTTENPPRHVDAAAAPSPTGTGTPPTASSDLLTAKLPSSTVDVMSFVSILRRKVVENDAAVIAANVKASELKVQFEQAEFKLFSVSKRYQSFRMNAMEELAKLRSQVTELQAELAACKGTDYLSSNSELQLESNTKLDVAAPPPTSPRGSAVLPRGSPLPHDLDRVNRAVSDAEGDEALQVALQEANDRLRAVYDERNAMVVYQHMAKKAIRMLHRDRDEMARRLLDLTSTSGGTR